MSKETISRITDKVIEEMQTWVARPLEPIYAAIFIDAIMVKVRDVKSRTGRSTPPSGSPWAGRRTSWACGRERAGRARSSG